MHLTEFLRKHKRDFSIYALELHCRVPRNTIAHAIGNEKRTIAPAYEDAIFKYFEIIYDDFNEVLVKHYQGKQDIQLAKHVSSPNGSNTDKRRSSKRQVR